MEHKSGLGSYLKISILIFVCCIFLINNVTASDGAMFRGDPQHTGVYDNGGINPDGILVWEFTTGSGIDSSPVVSNGVVYTGSNDNNIYALDAATGVKIWNYTTEGPIFSSPAVVNGIVYIGSGEGNIQTQVYRGTFYALDAATGVKIWNFNTLGEFKSSPAVMDGVVYVGSVDDNVYALNAITGTEIWHFDIGEMTSSPAVADGIVYIGSGDGNIYALNATNGDEIWRFSTGFWITSSPAVENGIVYVGSYDHNVYALNATNGAEVWRYTTGSVVESSPAIANGVVYIGSNDNNVYALNAITGAEIWRYTTGYYVGSSPAVANGVVYVGSFDNNVYALDALTGTEIWHYSTGSLVMSSPAIANGMVYVGSNDHNMYAIGFSPDNTGSISFSSTPGGAQIYLDGSSTGDNTPYTLAGITAGQHAVTLKLKGYQDYNQDVTVTAGQTAIVHAALSPEGWVPITAPAVISSPGHYLLMNDLFNSTAETAIWIQSSDVVLNGDGHTLNGVSAENTTGVLTRKDDESSGIIPLSNITVINLSVSAFEDGIQYNNVDAGIVSGNTLAGNARGIEFLETSGTLVTGNNASGQVMIGQMNGVGIIISQSNGNTFTHNTLNRNGIGVESEFGGQGVLVIDDSSGNVFSNNTIHENKVCGILCEFSCNENVIANNSVQNNGDGIVLFDQCTSNEILNNHVEGNPSGIFLLESSGNRLRSNTLAGNTYNFLVTGNGRDDYLQDVDTSNTVDGKVILYLTNVTGLEIGPADNPGTIYAIDCQDLRLQDLTLSKNGVGGFFWSCDDITFENVTCSQNGLGLSFQEGSTSLQLTAVQGNENDEAGIFMTGVGNVVIKDSSASFNQRRGIFIDQSKDIAITNTSASHNAGEGIENGIGIEFDSCQNVSLDQTRTSINKYYGITFDGIDGMVIRGGVADGNEEVAIVALNSQDVEVSGMRISGNKEAGFGIKGLTESRIYNNYLNNMLNLDFADPGAETTAWNIQKTTGTNIVNGPFLGGNYWANPDGNGWSQVTPDRGDGFCSAPFIIDANNTDYLPLHTYTPIPSDYNITLGEGWNLVSVPKKLAPGYDTGSIFNNVMTEGHTIWKYDGVIRNWVPIYENTPVLPLYGFWIYSKYPTTVPLKFDPNPLQIPPTRKLVQGWELIGFTGTIPASARDTLISVRNNWTQAMGFDTTTYQYDIQIINGGSGQFSDERLMHPTKGYWLFMTGPGDLSAIGV